MDASDEATLRAFRRRTGPTRASITSGATRCAARWRRSPSTIARSFCCITWKAFPTRRSSGSPASGSRRSRCVSSARAISCGLGSRECTVAERRDDPGPIVERAIDALRELPRVNAAGVERIVAAAARTRARDADPNDDTFLAPMPDAAARYRLPTAIAAAALIVAASVSVALWRATHPVRALSIAPAAVASPTAGVDRIVAATASRTRHPRQRQFRPNSFSTGQPGASCSLETSTTGTSTRRPSSVNLEANSGQSPFRFSVAVTSTPTSSTRCGQSTAARPSLGIPISV